MRNSVRWSLGGVAIAGIVLSVPLFAQATHRLPVAAPALPELAENSVLDFKEDASTRMTVPVTIGQGGPYQFVVDTGAERTIISRELARKLALGRGHDVRMHSMNGVGQVSTVIIPNLGVSNWTVKRYPRARARGGRHWRRRHARRRQPQVAARRDRFQQADDGDFAVARA